MEYSISTMSYLMHRDETERVDLTPPGVHSTMEGDEELRNPRRPLRGVSSRIPLLSLHDKYSSSFTSSFKLQIA